MAVFKSLDTCDLLYSVSLTNGSASFFVGLSFCPCAKSPVGCVCFLQMVQAGSALRKLVWMPSVSGNDWTVLGPDIIVLPKLVVGSHAVMI